MHGDGVPSGPRCATRRRGIWIGLAVAWLAAPACWAAEAGYDIVLMNGRVMDPETRLDAVRNVGVRDGRIAAISEAPLVGRETVDVRGLVVAPGFIDLHAHGVDPFSSRLQSRDGVTTALELELGAFPVAQWYAQRDGKAVINYGASVGHPAARVSVMHGIEVSAIDEGSAASRAPPRPARWADSAMSPAEMHELQVRLQRGLDEGALGIGFGLAYTPAASRAEVWESFRTAANSDVLVHVHMRHSGEIEPSSTLGAVQEVLADAASTGASLHIAHIATTARRQLPTVLAMLDGARSNGVDVTTEVYPWEAAATAIGSAIFDEGWDRRTGATYRDLEWAATGERLTEEAFRRFRETDPRGSVIAHIIPAEAVEAALAHPGVIVVSDGPSYRDLRGHPRGAGSFARTLGRYVRERRVVSLMDAIEKMTLLPAKRLERFAPQMKAKGRMQVGADADITLFDAERVAERATYRTPVEPSTGILHVMVDGSFVVRDGEPVEGIYPGRAIRRHGGQ